jgi:CBS domain-containing protein
MTWKDISFMPVEDKRGNLVGLIGKDQAQTRIEEENRHQRPKDLLVRDVMLAMPETVGPDDLINIAIDKMNNSPFKCLPVVRKKELVGILTETNLNRIIKRVK